MSWRAALLACLAALCAAPAAPATQLPAGFDEITLADGLTAPTTVAWGPDGRLFIAEKAGVVKTVPPGGGPVRTLLDISDHVSDFADRGLLGLAVDAEFEQAPFLYLLYTHDQAPQDEVGPKTSRLTRVEIGADGTLVDPETPETVLLGAVSEAPCPAPDSTVDCFDASTCCHPVGTVRSAPDGTLWIGNGDGGTTLHTFNGDSYSGKLLHVDREGNGLPGHPFCAGEDDLTRVCTRVFALGLRNPYRFTLFRDSVIVGDVGQATWEEINIVERGANYGWPCYEGPGVTPGWDDVPRCRFLFDLEGTPNAAREPDYHYPSGDGSAVVMGPVYDGDRYPEEMRGDAFFGDYVQGWVRRLEFDAGGAVTGARDFATEWGGVSLEQAPGGNVVSVDFGWGVPGHGAVREWRHEVGNRAPHAEAAAEPGFGPAPLTVTLSGAGSRDPDGDELAYDWDFGDGSAPETGREVSHVYPPGDFVATLTVRDPSGLTDAATRRISSGNAAPVPEISAPLPDAGFRIGRPVALRGSATDAEDGELDGSRLTWRVLLHHKQHVHPFTSLSGATAVLQTTADHDADSYLEIRLTATDSRGLEATATRQLRPEHVRLELTSELAGAPVTYASERLATPHARDAAIGFETSVSAAATVERDGRTYDFVGWSDGGARAHQLTVPDSPLTLDAEYRDREPPAVRTAPGITGAPVEGGQLVADLGTWAGGPTLVRQGRWERCGADLASCTAVGAVDGPYDVSSADVGWRLRVVATATTSAGTTTAASAPSAVVVTPPRLAGVPRIVGVTTVGEQLEALPGAVSGSEPIDMRYVWLRCRSGTCHLRGETASPLLRLIPRDAGFAIAVEVRASNAGGTARATSDPTAPVARLVDPAPPTPPPADPPGLPSPMDPPAIVPPETPRETPPDVATGTGTLRIVTRRVHLRGRSAAIRVTCTGPAGCSGRLRVTLRRPVGRTRLLRDARLRLARGTRARVRVRLTSAQRRDLRRDGRLHAALRSGADGPWVRLRLVTR